VKPAVLLGMIRGADHIARALLQRAPLEIVTLYEPASVLLTGAGIKHKRLDDFATETHRAAVFHAAEQRAQAIATQLYTADFRRQWQQFDDETWSELRGALMGFLKRDLMEEMFLIDTLRRCALDVDLRLVLVPEDYGRDSRTAIASARRLGVPSLHVLHGYPYQTQNAHDVVSADLIAAFSEHCKSIIESFGARPDQVVVTGNPFWDSYAVPPASSAKSQVCAHLGLDPARPIVEYAMTGVHRFSAISQAHPRYHFETAEAVISAFAELHRAHPDWQFVLRPHPIEPIPVDQFHAYASRVGLPKLAIDDKPSEDALCAIDLFLCTHSNMGVEALLRGVPVVNVALDSVGGPVFREGLGPLFLDDDAVLHARSNADIVPAVEGAFSDPTVQARLHDRRPKTIARLNFANDGAATQRVCALALEMIRHGERYLKPTTRYPEFEPAIVSAIPSDSRRVHVVGRTARFVASAIRNALRAAEVDEFQRLSSDGPPCDALVLSDPVGHDSHAASMLSRAGASLAPGGALIAVFRNGASPAALNAFMQNEWAPAMPHAESPTDVGQFSLLGVEITLSRSGLEQMASFPVTASPGAASPGDALGWVVCAQPRSRNLSPYAAARNERKRRADLSNRIGERRFAKGNAEGAISAFVEAIQTWNEEALYFSNLAAALFAVQQVDNAWHRIREAIYLDPNHSVARANFRMIAHALGKSDEAERVLSLFGEDAPAS